MKTLDSFLKRYIPDLDVNMKEFAEAITMTGTKTETFEALDKNLENIVVGKILKIDKHPNADKLVVCQVDIGKSEPLQIVTGASNVYVGMLVPCVLDGGKVAASAHDDLVYPDGIVIKNGKLRGVDSFGMMCGIEELGKSRDLYGGEDGIYDLKEYGVKPGDNAIDKMLLRDYLYDFEITSNRVDCYSTIGIAREVAATFNKKITYPKENYKTTTKEANYVNIDIKDKDLCTVFNTRLIKNVKIAESPLWMKDILRKLGIRPINNIVDITNYVMMEYGQPLHAYDYSTIRDKKMVIKRAEKGEKMVTLDGKVRELDNTMLTICDGKGIIGLAGIMGGENTMITDNATTVLLESACFNGTNIRLTSKKVGLRTEASNLFEKGLDPNNAIKAIDRCCALIEELGIGDICEEKIYLYPDEKNLSREKEVIVDSRKISSLIGKEIDKKYMKEVLDKIDLKTTIDGDNLKITVPTWRKDIDNFADVTEEVLRYYGYDKIDATMPKGKIGIKSIEKKDLVKEYIYDVALFSGFNEIMNYSFESSKVYDKLKYSDDAVERNYIKIQNPLGEDFSIMRTQLINGMLQSLSTNYNRNVKTAKLFEVAKIYMPSDKDMKELPNEYKIIQLGAYGKDIDFFYMKGIAENILEASGVNDYEFKATDEIPFMHPYRTALITVNNEAVGYIGEIHKKVSDAYEIYTRTYVICLNIDMLVKYSEYDNKYIPISKLPSIDRDLSMLVPKDLEVSKIETIIKQRGGKLLEEYSLFDIYEGEQVKDGYKSLAYTMTFNDKEKSLKSEEIDSVIKKIVNGLNGLGIELRS